MGPPGHRAGARSWTPPARALVLGSVVSVQFGATIATRLFARVGPAGAVTFRLVFAAAMLALAGALAPGRRRPDRRRRARRSDLGVAVLFGLVLAGMNVSFYEAIARVPLGVGVTVEFSGPLAVTLCASRRRTDLIWATLAAAGVVLLIGRVGHHLDVVGVALALLAGACWAAYILLSAETGRRYAGTSGLTVAMVAGALAVLPLGVSQAGTRLVHPAAIGMGAAIALLSSVLPYSLELAALRRLAPRSFGILMSLEPAVAAVAGLMVLGQRLWAIELLALALVVAANAGSAVFDTLPVAALPRQAADAQTGLQRHARWHPRRPARAGAGPPAAVVARFRPSRPGSRDRAAGEGMPPPAG